MYVYVILDFKRRKNERKKTFNWKIYDFHSLILAERFKLFSKIFKFKFSFGDGLC